MIILKSLKNEKGQALVEFAIVLPVLLMLVMGIVQFGMMQNSYLAIENASREGARAGIVGSTDAEIESLIIASSPSLDPAYLTVYLTPSEANRRSGDTLTVTVTYNYKFTIPIISSIFNDGKMLTGQTSMRIE